MIVETLRALRGGEAPAGKGTRAVPSLGAKRISGGSTLITIPNVAAGLYHVLACADDLNVVKEVSDTNNCTASVGVIQVTHERLPAQRATRMLTACG